MARSRIISTAKKMTACRETPPSACVAARKSASLATASRAASGAPTTVRQSAEAKVRSHARDLAHSSGDDVVRCVTKRPTTYHASSAAADAAATAASLARNVVATVHTTMAVFAASATTRLVGSRGAIGAGWRRAAYGGSASSAPDLRRNLVRPRPDVGVFEPANILLQLQARPEAGTVNPIGA